MLKKYRKRKKIEQQLVNLNYSLYMQIVQYNNRADTKYHRGIIDALESVKVQIEKILGDAENNVK